MPSEEQLEQGFKIGEWWVLPRRRLLRRDGEEIAPEPKVFGVLMSLARRGGDVVSRDELVDEVWGGRVTGDEAINRCVSQLRKHLGDTRPYRYIKPITGSGYVLAESVLLPDPDIAAGSEQEIAAPRRKLWPLMLAIAVAAFAGYVLTEAPKRAGQLDSIVVLPLDETGSAAGYEYLGPGFRDEFADALQQVENLAVKIARDPLIDQTAEEIGRRFDVDSVLRGSIQRNGDELKVSYQVFASHDGNLISSSNLVDDVGNAFDMQEKIARQVREDLFGSRPRDLVSSSRPATFGAYNLYLQGTYALERRGNPGNLEQATEFFEKTIELDPTFGPAYLQLATATALLPVYRGASVLASNQRAIEIVDRGIAADDSIEASAGAVLGFVHHSQKEWVQSENAYRRATTASVVDPNAFNWYSRMLASVGRLDEALRQATLAWEMDPENTVINSRMAWLLSSLGDVEQAYVFFDRARRLGAEGSTHMLGEAIFLLDQGELEKSRSMARIAADQAGLSQGTIDLVLDAIVEPERSGEALRAVNEAIRDGTLTPQIEVVARTYLGDIDGAMQVAKRLIAPGEAFEMDLLWIPAFQALREHSEFTSLIDALGVVDYWQQRGCNFNGELVQCTAR